MKTAYIFILSLFLAVKVFAQEVPVFESGKEGHKSYRIPAIISLPNSEILAFCEGRVNGSGDFGDINIVLKTSVDKGKTWGALQTVVDNDKLQAGNPAPVVDMTDPKYPKGRIFLFYNMGNNGEGEVRKGNGLREVWCVTSVDAGKTWSKPVNITTQTHRPKQPQVNPKYNFSEDWRSYANTPGHAMQFDGGKFKGRIFVAANHSSGEPQASFKDYQVHGFYTDDHGKTFKLSETVSFAGGNESTAAQLTGDKLMMNSRNQQGNVRRRIVSISSNGGKNWDTTFYDQNLPDPVNQGSITSFTDKKGRRMLAFCNAANEKRRDNLTLRLSNDDGKTWFKNIVIAKSPEGYAGNSYSAYSDILKLDEKTIGVLYEKDNYKSIVFTPVKWK